MVAKMSEQTAVKHNHQLSMKRQMLSRSADQKMGIAVRSVLKI